jgi:hypothetical protein
MTLRTLPPPKFKQQRRHVPNDGPHSMNLGVAPRTERDYQVQDRSTWNAMVHDDGTLIPA